MTRTLGNMLLWLASRAGRLGFKLRGADVTDMCCYLSLMPTPERRRRQMELLEKAIANAYEWGGVTYEQVNTVAPSDRRPN